MTRFLPASRAEMQALGWDELDVIIINGDAYVDHPSFGAAVIGRVLQNAGYRTGIISQPQNDTDFTALGTPRLFFGVTAGNLDSLVANYTPQGRLRSEDAYSEGGKPGLRPDRAVLAYCQSLRRLFKGCKLVLGGLEASLRRLPHYDFISHKVRNSVLLDAKADCIVYGMGEKPVLAVADSLNRDGVIATDIPGTVVSVKDCIPDAPLLPTYPDCTGKDSFWDLHHQFYTHHLTKTLFMPFAGRFLRHNPPALPLSTAELDAVYALPYTRQPHPMYKQSIPAWEQIRLSLTSHRGCFGGCNFCAIGVHQGKSIQSRSRSSMEHEIDSFADEPYYRGVISDAGGPTANMYGLECSQSTTCPRRSCLVPDICPNLNIDQTPYRKLLTGLRRHKRVNQVYVASGIRHDLALLDPEFIDQLAAHHVGGHLKTAPEERDPKVLELMHKPSFAKHEQFERIFALASQKARKEQYIIPYIIIGHPGSSLNSAVDLAVYLKERNWKLRQVQEFTPTPMTVSTLMYYTGMSYPDHSPVSVPTPGDMKLMKALLLWYKPENRDSIAKALEKAGRTELKKFFGVY